MPNFNELVAEYKSSNLTERQKAELEESIYQTATVERVRKSGEDRVDFLSKTLSIQKYDCSNRAGLRGRGTRVDLLWARVENDSLPVRTAIELARKAETDHYNSHAPFEESLARVLAEYDAKPVTLLPSGKFIKVQRGGGRKPKRQDKAVETQSTPASTEDTPVAKSARDTWRVIRQLIETMLRERMAGCDPIFIETTARDFGVDLSALIESYQSRVNRMGSSLRGESLLPTGSKEMSVVNDACRTLNLDDIEEVGDVIDIIRARKNAKAFLAKFHPDKNPGENQKLFEKKYQAVVNALGVIEEYNEKHGAHHAGSAV